MGGLFDTFTVAKRGLSVQQSNINTTSHNIANAQTPGYTRQRSVVETTRPFGGMSRYDTFSAGQIGTGAEVTTIMRIRDSFLDYQVRQQTTKCGTAEIKNKYLAKVDGVLDETKSTGIQGALSEFYSKFQNLTRPPVDISKRTQAMIQARNVAEALNQRYRQLENEKSGAQLELSTDVIKINDTLDKINVLNKQIDEICVGGMSPNDLMDKRDYLIDELSSKFGVKIEKQQREAIDLSVSQDTTVGKLVNSNPNDRNYSRFSYVENAVITGSGANKALEVTYNVLGDKNNQKKIKITDGDLEALQKDLLEDRILVGDKDGIVSDSTTLNNTNANVISMNNFITTIKDIGTEAADFTAGNGWTINGTTSATKGDTTVYFDTNGKVTSAVKSATTGSLPNTTTTTTTVKFSSDGTVTSAEESAAVTGGNTTTITATSFNASGQITDAKQAVTDGGKTILSNNQVSSKIFNNVTEGEIAGNQQVQDTIQGYIKQLDKFTAAFAYSVNAIQTGSLVDGASNIAGYPAGQQAALIFVVKDNNGVVTSSDTGITAKNITISADLDPDKLTNNPGLLNLGEKHVDNVSGENDGTRAQAIADIKNLKIDLGSLSDNDIKSRSDFFIQAGATGTAGIGFAADNMNLTNKKNGSGNTLLDYYGSIVGTVYSNAEAARNDLTSQQVQLTEYDNDRLSISGVSLDEEMADLIQFQHSYQANAKMISTIDELLDVVINGLKR